MAYDMLKGFLSAVVITKASEPPAMRARTAPGTGAAAAAGPAAATATTDADRADEAMRADAEHVWLPVSLEAPHSSDKRQFERTANFDGLMALAVRYVPGCPDSPAAFCSAVSLHLSSLGAVRGPSHSGVYFFRGPNGKAISVKVGSGNGTERIVAPYKNIRLKNPNVAREAQNLRDALAAVQAAHGSMLRDIDACVEVGRRFSCAL